MEPLKESCLSSEILVEGLLLKVHRDEVRLPDGSTGVREYLRHPGAVVMVPLFPDETTILVRQYRYAPGSVFIELPAGKLDGREELTEAVRRELAEETGYHCRDMILLSDFYPCIGYSDERMWLYLVYNLSPVPAQSDADEFIEKMRIPFTQAIDMVRSGQINDMKSMLGLLLAENYLRYHSLY